MPGHMGMAVGAGNAGSGGWEKNISHATSRHDSGGRSIKGIFEYTE